MFMHTISVHETDNVIVMCMNTKKNDDFNLLGDNYFFFFLNNMGDNYIKNGVCDISISRLSMIRKIVFM
jgi:hypothetical protein